MGLNVPIHILVNDEPVIVGEVYVSTPTWDTLKKLGDDEAPRMMALYPKKEEETTDAQVV